MFKVMTTEPIMNSSANHVLLWTDDGIDVDDPLNPDIIVNKKGGSKEVVCIVWGCINITHPQR